MPYRVITTTYEYVHEAEDAYELAISRRREGKRTEIITEDEFKVISRQPAMHTMQDLLEWRRKHMLGLPA